jgi:predicted nuclease of predicted toxin-antitoxin system
MAKYLIDVNLPYYFGLWNNSNYIHVKDIDDSLSDHEIWKYAKDNSLIIGTKDADFSLKALSGEKLPNLVKNFQK